MKVETEIVELVYHKPIDGGQQHPNPEFIIPIDKDLFGKWRKDHGSVSLMDVVSSPDIFINRNGSRSGILERPSNQQLKEAFGTDDFVKVFDQMSEKGELMPAHHHFQIISNTKPTYVSRHHTFTR